ncbi:hypothetical protein U3516DRAFT_775970 [Neocallimastix sp. 'constans']|jgi:hypothetical protein
MEIDQYFQEEEIDNNICRWNLSVYNCKDEEYFRSVYYVKLVIAICVSLLDSVLIIYRLGIKRRNIITPYGIASIDGLLLFTALYSYSMIFHSINILKGEYVVNFILQEYSFQSQYIFLLIAIQIYLTGTLNASPRYQGSKFYYPRPRVANTISFIALIIWISVEIVGIYFVGSTRNFFYTSSNSELKKIDAVFQENKRKYLRWTNITYFTFCGACLITFVLFFFFGIHLTKAAKRSLEEMYRSKKIKSNVVIPIQIALFKMKWINGACNVIMLSFSCLFAAMALSEEYIFDNDHYISVLSKILCIIMNLIPPALTFIVLLSIVYGEARTDIISVFPSTHYEEEEYQMNYTRQSQEI